MESARGRGMLLCLITLVFVSAVVSWPIVLLARSISSPNLPRRPTGGSTPPAAHWPAVQGTALTAATLALWLEWSLARADLNLRPFAGFYGLPPSLERVLWTLPVLLVLAVALAGLAVHAWRCRIGHPVHRLHYTLVAVALAFFLYTFYSQHLLFIG